LIISETGLKALELLQSVKEVLQAAHLDAPQRDGELIVSHYIGTDRVHLFRDNPDISGQTLAEINECVERRKKREPLHYILGFSNFCGLKIHVGQGVLVPRPETELMVEEAVRIVRNAGKGTGTEKKQSNLKILDLCTGSGCIGLALAKEFPDAEVYGTDTSDAAVDYAEENARINAVRNIAFLRGSLFDPIKKRFASQNSRFTADLIISNPPYIKRADMKKLQPEIRDWEPREALDGGEDGLDYYRIIIPNAKEYLKIDGYLILELGVGQAGNVTDMAADAGFHQIALKKDYAGIERILILRTE
jgi:release factor glutamine methyltransferase